MGCFQQDTSFEGAPSLSHRLLVRQAGDFDSDSDSDSDFDERSARSPSAPFSAPSIATRAFLVIVAYETSQSRLLFAPALIRACRPASSCVIAQLKIQYFLYFRRNAPMLGLNRRERPGYKWSRRNGEVRTLLVSHAGPLAGLP